VLIDWFTVAAQILNFLILVALLKRFLYDRIIRAMDEREEKVRSRLEEAEKKEKEREEEAEKYRQKNREIEEKRKEMLDKAKEEAENQRKDLTKKARQEVETLRIRWQESLQREKTSFLRELRQMTGHQVYAISRRVLRDLAEADLEERVVRVFLRELENMKKKERNEMAEAIREDGNNAIVRSGFEISSTQRQQITRTLREQIAEDADVHYETDPEIIMGIDLKSHGEKVAWSIEGYLKTLEEEIRVTLEREIEDRREKEQGDQAEEKEGKKQADNAQSRGQKDERKQKEQQEGKEDQETEN
jgi:F-type H+-transporting ATPase subunit b